MKALLTAVRRARQRLPHVEFCETCSEVCDRRCRADAIRDRAVATYYGLHL